MSPARIPLRVAVLILAAPAIAFAAEEEPWSEGFTPPPGKYSWVQLDTGEWLKGDITALYDDVLVFDSDHFDDLNIDLEDILQIRAVGTFQVSVGDRMRGNRRTVIGEVLLEKDTILVASSGRVREFHRDELLSITQTAEREFDRWTGDIGLGWNFREGNSNVADFSLNAGFRRRTPISRVSLDYIGNRNETEGELISDSHRVTFAVDRFTSTRFFWRPISAQYYKDELQNIKHQATVDTGAGYHIIDTSRTLWEVQAGVGGNYLENVSVEPGQPNGEWSPIFTIGTDFEIELTSWMDYELYIDMTFLEERAGKYQHHIVSNISTDLTGNLDLDLVFIWDRTENPQADQDSIPPEQDDYRFEIRLAYDF
jgi:putative salt-induced outer membrane protein YdiY